MDSISIGQLCFDGTVAAADEWYEMTYFLILISILIF
jgi:hypothetical protein